ncbi:MAG TPA: PspC domain-containing protein [Nocardioides sp.]|nr:PspC domain-containing protein [Nocardioides sp.]
MTETHTQPEEQPRTGLATENLRSYERLRRSVTDRKIAGVAGGLGRHLNIDPTVLRVLLVVLVFFGGAGVLIYAAAWLLVPEEGTERSIVQTSPSTRNTLLIVVGVLGALLLIGDTWGGVGFPWPLALIGLVVAVVLLNRDSGTGTASPAGPSHPGTPPAASATPAGSTLASQETTMADPNTPTTTLDPTPPAPPVGPWSYPVGGYPTPPAPPAPDRGPKLFGPTVALLLVALGSLGLYDSVGGDVVDAAYPALALTVVGVMLVVGAFVGRAGGLIFLGVVAALALGITASAQDNWSTDTRLSRTPATAADVRSSYDITAGQIRLDLTEVEDLENLDGRRLDLEATAGEILVLVPDGIDVDVDGSIRLGGEIEVDGVVENGNGVDLNRRIDGGDDVSQLYLELDLVVGHIEVRQEEAA